MTYNIPKILYNENPKDKNDLLLYLNDNYKNMDEHEKYLRLLLISHIDIPKFIYNDDNYMQLFMNKKYYNIEQFDFNSYFFVGRVGNTEMKILYKYIDDDEIKFDIHCCSKRAWMNSGIYPITHKYLSSFSNQYYDAVKNTTHVYNHWKNIPHHNMLEAFLIQKCNNIIPEQIISYSDWFIKLNNKRILIISPFVDYMKKQWDSENIFKCHNYHDATNVDIKLSFIKMPYALAYNKPHNNWIETYSYIIGQINEDFDIALVSAGGYGMLFCNYIYTELKKSAIYIGGPLQCFFGIKGKRYDEFNIYNEYWISIDEKNKPVNYKFVEDGCYW